MKESVVVVASAQPRRGWSSAAKCLALLGALITLAWFSILPLSTRLGSHFLNAHTDTASKDSLVLSQPVVCRPPLPQLVFRHPLSTDHATVLSSALAAIDESVGAFFEEKFESGELDSVALAVVTPAGSAHEAFWGVLKANETGKDGTRGRGKVDRNTVYRLASISKLFTSIESFILRDRDGINFDQPLTDFIPDLAGRHARQHSQSPPLTIRQLMSHLSGLGRDWPPGDASPFWPRSLNGSGPPWYNGLPYPTRSAFLAAIGEYEEVMNPYGTLPSYSNTGFALLGLANLVLAQNAAAKANEGAPKTNTELLQRDVFGPLGMASTSYAVTDDMKDRIAVASILSEETDQVFDDLTNAAGGQMSSLADLINAMHMFLDPEHVYHHHHSSDLSSSENIGELKENRRKSVLSAYTIREWLRPVIALWDDWAEVGLTWEIYKFRDAFGRVERMYQKVGELNGHHTLFSLNPTSHFGVIILTTGATLQTYTMNNEIAFPILQKAIDEVNEELVRKKLVGGWRSPECESSRTEAGKGHPHYNSDYGCCSITTTVEHGSLFVTEYTINGSDVLSLISPGGESKPALLIETREQEQEFRVAPTLPGMGCFHVWIGMDDYGYMRGVAPSIVRFKSESTPSHRERPTGLKIELPALGVELSREEEN